MKTLKSIISGFLAVAIVFLSCVPAYAAVNSGTLIDAVDVFPGFVDWFISSSQSTANFFKGFLFDDVCKGAGATLNNRHIFEVQHTTINGKLGYYNICKNCGKSAGEVFEPAYEEKVSELPAQGYTSDGSLLYSPPHDSFYCSYCIGVGINMKWFSAGCEHFTSGSSEWRYTSVFDCNTNSVILRPLSGNTSFGTTDLFFVCNILLLHLLMVIILFFQRKELLVLG